ncbi:hypothetical protein [Nocardioides bruguierae]|uniref:Uncharacterized protein n=1 Tax=Nocardioides bruguierae TaxID=2945102 RepID=A0A9X2D6C2_9ACTN|nr:hypothetical protein [Nocardioides bruguierae]MCM0619049.1 hypothetical protein [Nocardioides bruguierae]
MRAVEPPPVAPTPIPRDVAWLPARQHRPAVTVVTPSRAWSVLLALAWTWLALSCGVALMILVRGAVASDGVLPAIGDVGLAVAVVGQGLVNLNLVHARMTTRG